MRSTLVTSITFWTGSRGIAHVATVIGACLAMLLAAGSGAAFAQEGAEESSPSGREQETILAHRLGEGASIELDGRLAEPAWSRIEPSGGFRQLEPDPGARPTERTRVRVAYDADHLYIAAELFDSDPSGIKAFQRRRDQSLATDDRFMWILDTFHDGRSAYYFEVNPAGLRGDGLISTGQGFELNKSWDGIWDAEVRQTSEGWIAEIRIPFRSLNFDTGQSVWGINFQRTIRRKNEEVLWNGRQRNRSVFRPQDAGTLTGLEDISQGPGLEIVPYGTASSSQDWEGGDMETDPGVDAGIDLNYSLTTNLRTSLTVNTDFAETEVDQRRVNLTRFPLFFPEKRDFFLEGAGIFQYAPSSNVHPFFSRRIGLVGGEPIPIRFGGRMTGRAGPYQIGFYQVQTGDTETRQPEDFTAARLKRDVLSESTAGLVFTRRSTHAGPGVPEELQPRYTFGGDFEYGTSTFLGDKNLQFQAFFVGHNRALETASSTLFDRTARGVRYRFANEPWDLSASYREYGSSWDPAVGFAARNGYRRFQPSHWYRPLLSGSDWIRRLIFRYRFEYLMDLDFRPMDVVNRFRPVGIEFETGDEIAVEFAKNFQRLDRPFDIKRDGSIILPPGRYHEWVWGVEAESAGYRRIAAEAELTGGEFWSGTRTELATELSLRPWPGVNVSGFWRYSDVNLAEGAFDTHLLRMNTDLDLTTEFFYTLLVQYDNLSEQVGLFSRIRWILKPGSDLYLVYNHNWRRTPEALVSLESQADLKLTYTYRF